MRPEVQAPASRGDALDDCPVAVVSVAADARVRRWNPACVRLLGIEAGTALAGRLEAVLRFQPRDRAGRFPERQWAVTADRRVPVGATTWESRGGEERLLHYWVRDSRRWPTRTSSSEPRPCSAGKPGPTP